MKTLLLLSSGRFLEKDVSGFIGKPWEDLRIAHIITASKGKGVSDPSFISRSQERFKKHNCYFEDLDIAGMDEDTLRAKLSDFNAVFVNGGNSFYLLKAIRESGFDKVIKELLPQGFIYIGASAGSYVACPTIEMATWKHKDKYDHYGLADLSALNLVPFLVTAHYSEQYHDILQENIYNTSFETKILNDDQAILVKGDKVELLGGEEIKL